HPSDGTGIPQSRFVTKRRIKYPARSVHLCPRDRKIAVGAVNERSRQIERAGVEMRQHAKLAAREILQLIVLVMNRRTRRKAAHGGKLRFVDHDGRIGDAPWMLVEP